MNLREYQEVALLTDQGREAPDPIVPLLGLAGEAGSLATAYKKFLRDGDAFVASKVRLREELGDVLWYVAVLASRFDLDLDEVAVANLDKVRRRWQASPPADEFFDSRFPDNEQLPRRLKIQFLIEREETGRELTVMRVDGQPVGDPLTDASRVTDDYRFHDAFHLAYWAVLGWSPVSRKLHGRKRRSDKSVDEAEDGGRAIVIEEGLAALVFAYAATHSYFDGVNRVDSQLLATITDLTRQLEVSIRREADWERAILTGFRVWRALRRSRGGVVHLDMYARSLDFSEV